MVSRDKRYYRCTTNYIANDTCIGAFVSHDDIEKAVLKELSSLINMYLDKDQLTTAIRTDNNMQERKKKIEIEIAGYEKKICEYEKAIKDLYLDKVKGLISDDQFVGYSKDFFREQERAIIDKDEAEKRLADAEKAILNANNKRTIVEQYINVQELNRTMVEELIESITVKRRSPKTKELAIQINWNF